MTTARSLTARVILTLIGAALLIASAFLPWLGFEGGPIGTEVPFQFLWSPAERPVPSLEVLSGMIALIAGFLGSRPLVAVAAPTPAA
jgi:hypothetical protein